LQPQAAEESDSLAADKAFGSTLIEIESAGALREAAWAVSGFSGTDVLGDDLGSVPRWSSAVQVAVRHALQSAHEAGVTHVGVAHLTAVLLDDRGNRAHELVNRSGLDAKGLLDEIHRANLLRTNAVPAAPTIYLLGLLGFSRVPLPLRLVALVSRKQVARRAAPGPVIYVLNQEAIRQCVRLGHQRVAPIHLVLSVASFDEQLSVSRTKLRLNLLHHNQGGEILRKYGATFRALIGVAGGLGDSSAPTAPKMPPVGRAEPGWYPGWTVDALEATMQTPALARRMGHSDLGADHLLSSTLVLADGALHALVQSCGVDVALLQRDLERSLQGAK
jgi:hypothetical protein